MKMLLPILSILFIFLIVYLAVYGYGWCGGFVGKKCPVGFWCKQSDRALLDAPGKCVLNPFVK